MAGFSHGIAAWALVLSAPSPEGAAPAGSPTPEAVREGLRRHLEALRPPGAPPGRYRPAPGKEPTLLASCDAVFLLWIARALPGEAERKAWAEEIRSRQNPETGEWPGGLHRFGMACRALNMLGGTPRHPLRFLEAFEDPESMERWLDARDWGAPWGASIEVLHVATPRVRAIRRGDVPGGETWVKRFFARLEAHQDPRTGLWGTTDGASLWEGMGGAFHFFPIYRADPGRSIPRAERMFESVMRLRRPDGSFREGYGQMDACHMLLGLAREIRDPAARRRARDALRGVLRNLLQTWDADAGIFRGARDLHGMVAVYQTLGYTARAAPDHPLARLDWRDAWSPSMWDVELPSRPGR